MKLSDDKNLAFMNDPRRISAQNELDNIVEHIRADLNSQGNALYYFTVLPPLLKRLEKAYENVNIIETKIMRELEGK